MVGSSSIGELSIDKVHDAGLEVAGNIEDIMRGEIDVSEGLWLVTLAAGGNLAYHKIISVSGKTADEFDLVLVTLLSPEVSKPIKLSKHRAVWRAKHE